jgi:hypothetical protein
MRDSAGISPPRPPRPAEIAAPARTAAGDEDSHASSPSSAGAPPSGKGRRTTVSGLARSGLLATDPPPELDGSRRRRMVKVLAVGLVLGAAAVTWGVVRSQLKAVPASEPGEVSTVVPIPTAAPPPPTPEIVPTTTATAVDPGKVSRPIRPTPSVKPAPGPRGRPKKPQDGSIEIPDVPDDSVPAAP